MIIHGSVQGVFYRANTRDKAVDLGLNGWVRNTHNGTVEVFAEGSKDKLDYLINFCRDNPGYSHVDDIIIEWGRQTNKYEGFRITH